MPDLTPEAHAEVRGTTVVHAAVAQPGDTLFIGIEAELPDPDLQRIADDVRSLLPAGVDVVMLGGVRAVTVIRPQADG